MEQRALGCKQPIIRDMTPDLSRLMADVLFSGRYLGLVAAFMAACLEASSDAADCSRQ